MKMFVKTSAALALAAAMVSAQSMEETVSKLGASAGKAYVAPIVSGFGVNLNSGWYHKAPPPKKFGFNIEAGAVFMGTLLSGGAKNLDVVGAFRMDSTQAYSIANSSVDTSSSQGKQVRNALADSLRNNDIQVSFAGPTIIGSGSDGMSIQVAPQPVTIAKPFGTGDTTIQIAPYNDSIPEVTGILGDFADLPLPLFAPQLTIGTIYGTNLTLRWLPEIETNKDIGTVKFFGFGVQHNPGVWFGSSLPVDLSVGYFMQSLEVGTLFKATSQAYGLNVSKTLGWRFLNLTPYGGFMYESSSFDFSYDLEVDGKSIPVAFTLDGENKYRATAGLSIRLLAININGDYNFGKYQSFSAGVMVGI